MEYAQATQARLNKIPTLIHYQSFNADRLTETLEKNTIYCSNPADFNDPWDMKPLIKDLDDERIRHAYAEYLRSVMMNRNYPIDRIEVLLSTPYFVDKLSKYNTYNMWEQLEKNFRVYCLTPEPDNLLMWSHYADKHHGICLEFDTENSIFGSAWMVEYYESYPYYPWMGDFDIVKLALTKAKYWEYEKEYRLLPKTEHANKIIPQDMVVDEDNKLTFPSNALKSVIIGCKSKSEEIKKIVEKIRPEIKIKYATMAKNRYAIDIN